MNNTRYRYWRRCTGIAIVLSLLSISRVHGFDAVTAEFGSGDDGINRYGLALQWDWSAVWVRTGSWELGGYWELSGSYWDGDDGRSGTDSLVEVGLTPVFRFQRQSVESGLAPFAELGIGVHIQSRENLEDKDFGTLFAFGSHLGFGMQFGSDQAYEISYRFQHLSNAGIGDDNPGINFHMLRLGYRF